MDNGFPVLEDTAYRIEAKIGSGGGGVIYKAWHTRLQKYVVLRRIKDDSNLIQLGHARIETDILKNLKHPNLPQIYDFLEDLSGVYTVMEFIPGQSFAELLKNGGTFTQFQILNWAQKLAGALSHLHSQTPPVFHGDIKPGNIMLTETGDICLIDFNISLILDDKDKSALGLSHGYSSPEQYGSKTPVNKSLKSETATEIQNEDQKTQLDTRSDIYSLGATLYHLAAGEKPAIATNKIKPLSGFNKDFKEAFVYVIERCMEYEPAKRFQTAEELHRALINIHKYDSNWKISRIKMIAASIILPLIFAASAILTLYGSSLMSREKEGRFYSAVFNIERGDNAEASYYEAIGIFRDRIEPYLSMARRLWADGSLDECRKFIEENLGNIAVFQNVPDNVQSFGDIYYILGSCYYYEEPPDYNAAANSFGIAVKYAENNPVYYRDYAVTLARTGKIDEAERNIELALELNIDADSLNLLNGEIAFAKREYDNSAKYLALTIELTTDDYVRYRAYHTSDEIFKLTGRPELSVAMLNDAINKIPLNRISEVTLRLADAYIKTGDYESAIILFEQIAERNAPQFYVMQNLAILLHNTGELERASDILFDMADLFPSDYRIPMRQAYLEADKQSRTENNQRDYTLTKQYYETAVLLYQNYSGAAADSDPEMQELDILMEQLRLHNWIN